MSGIEFKGWFIATTIFSVLMAFLVNIYETRKLKGTTYSSIMLAAWMKIISILGTFGLYTAVCFYSSGWKQLFQSPELVLAAFFILFETCRFMGNSLTLKGRFPIDPRKVNVLSTWCLVWLCIALTTLVSIVAVERIPMAAVLWQFILLFVAIATYFGTVVVLKLLSIGHVFQKSVA
ncbi:hypothetical protein [Vibrio ordalii]|uniref:Uncharacterized protein n=1 Tax=Vibrio ordalii FS-238 TaxID=617133 RepID=A0A853R793_9VIBR|nr:hypothetical protein [Vibrio ordalii]OEE38974.1 hypothetical protein A1QS_15380 [Vibrio ordalii FS-238]